MFSEPVKTADILKLFPDIKLSVSKTKAVKYNYTSRCFNTHYYKNSDDILSELNDFVSEYKLLKLNIKVAVCLFGEQRNLIDHIPYWQYMKDKLQTIDFYTAMYIDPSMNNTIGALTKTLDLKDYHIAYNDLDKFNSLKFNAKSPIYIYKTDPKATMPRLLSQLYIRQKSVQLVDFNQYDVILLCRTDIKNLNLSINDIIDVANDKQLLIASNELNHIHPGGGSGCIECSKDARCDKEYHANDICDLWCLGSTDAMKPWLTIYDDALTHYSKIQKKSIKLNDKKLVDCIKVEDHLTENEIHISFNQYINLIENDVHCFYPEKLMRVAFKDLKICKSNNKDETRNK